MWALYLLILPLFTPTICVSFVCFFSKDHSLTFTPICTEFKSYTFGSVIIEIIDFSFGNDLNQTKGPSILSLIVVVISYMIG